MTDCATQFPITNGGNPNLKPETSKNFTAGIVLEPTNQLSVALDYFNIELKETISNGVPAATILSDLAKYGSLVTRGAPSGGLPGPIVNIDQTNINLGETKLSGWDLDVKWGIPSGYGKFTVGLNGTYYMKYDVQNPDGSFTSAIDNANNNTGGVVPRWKHYAFAELGDRRVVDDLRPELPGRLQGSAGNVRGSDRSGVLAAHGRQLHHVRPADGVLGVQEPDAGLRRART